MAIAMVLDIWALSIILMRMMTMSMIILVEFLEYGEYKSECPTFEIL